VLFPIRNLSGDVVGLGGRIMGDGEPKYLNSAETPIYNKRDNLFGLDLTRNGIRDAGEAVVVEGYFDFASLYQAGVGNVVATLGTSFAEEQVSLLRRFTDRVVMNYDPDTAGATATRRSIDLLLAQSFKVRVLQLEPGLDPDDFVRKRGLESYRTRLAESPRYFDYLLSKAIAGKDVADYEVKSAVLKEILPVITQVPDRIERSGYINMLAEKLALDDAMMLAEIRDSVLKAPVTGRTRPAHGQPSSSRPENRIMEAEARLIRALLENADICPDLLMKLADEDLAGSPIEGMLRAVESLSRENAEISYASLNEILDEPARSVLAGLAMKLEPVVSREEAYRCVETIRLRRLRQERESLQKQMEREMDTARLDDLMRRKMELSRQIDSLS
jgi:DNA primase